MYTVGNYFQPKPVAYIAIILQAQDMMTEPGARALIAAAVRSTAWAKDLHNPRKLAAAVRGAGLTCADRTVAAWLAEENDIPNDKLNTVALALGLTPGLLLLKAGRAPTLDWRPKGDRSPSFVAKIGPWIAKGMTTDSGHRWEVGRPESRYTSPMAAGSGPGDAEWAKAEAEHAWARIQAWMEASPIHQETTVHRLPKT